MRIGISMRRMQTKYEQRDGLSTDWAKFFHRILPGVAWMPLPNNETAVLDSIREFRLNSLILSGGDDWGIFPERDRTEIILLKYAEKHDFPVLGVCRGAQIINRFCKGKLSPVSPQNHLATRHSIDFSGKKITVNSFHAFGISPDGLGKNLKATGLDSWGNIEAFSHDFLPWQGILWHPEREKSPTAHDKKIFQKLFLNGEKK